MDSRRLRAEPRGLWRRTYHVVDGRGVPITSWAASGWRRGGPVEIDGQPHELRRDGGRRLRLLGPAGVVATAERSGGAWTDTWTVRAGERVYRLRRRSWWRPDRELVQDGTVVGRVSRSGFRGGAVAELPAELSTAAQVFVLLVVLTLWHREAAAAAAAGPGAAGGS